MRTLLVALAIAGCSRAPTAVTPANKAPAPDYAITAKDELGFLLVDADFVVGVDITTLRGSQLWRSFEPQIDAFMRQAQEQFGGCGDFMKTLERMTMSFKVTADNQLSGVVVMQGGDMAAALECTVQTAKKSGKTATMDRGVLLLTKEAEPDLASASKAVGTSTLVVHLDKNASYDSIHTVLASGAPLRKSGSFMTLFERRERGASVWGMANGNAALFNELAQMGMRPKSRLRLSRAMRVRSIRASTPGNSLSPMPANCSHSPP